MLKLFPKPKSICEEDRKAKLSSALQLQIDPLIQRGFEQAGYACSKDLQDLFSKFPRQGRTLLEFVYSGAVAHEGYKLTVSENGIQIVCSSAPGGYYGVCALRQITEQCGDTPPCLTVEDAPAMAVRGVMLDIGRDKIPRMETLLHMIDMLSAMRINHLQLYMEGFCFDYAKYRSLFSDETPVTAEEFRQLADYARSRFIDLVPNQNCLGHMDQWLALPQFRRLAECPDGFLHQGLYLRPPMTLDAYNPQAEALVEYFLDSLLPNFHSRFVNVNLDEPFELGKGNNRKAAQKCGIGRMYLDYIKKVHGMCDQRGKKMMMWGDVVFTHPELIQELPEDITILDWIYEGDASFESHCRLIAETGRAFCLCPGTSSWCSFTGRTDNMVKNIADAARCAKEYGAKGVIVTDWGDLGHWQYLPMSYLGFAYAASCSWSGGEVCAALVEEYCDRAIFRDAEQKTARLLHDLGNYYHFEHATLYNTTLSFAVMSSKYRFQTPEEFPAMMGRMLRISENIAGENAIPFTKPSIEMDYSGLAAYLADIEERAKCLHPGCEDGVLIREEILNALRMIRHGSRLYRVMTEHTAQDALFSGEMRALFDDLCGIMEEHYRLWCARSRTGGYRRSTEQMRVLLNFYLRYSGEK